MRKLARQRERSLETRDQRYKARKWDRMFVSRGVIMSAAFGALKTATACRVFLIFLSKCQWERAQVKPGSRDKAWVLVNNGQIQFTYNEAWEKYHIPPKKFTRAIDALICVGLIDVAHSGFGLEKDVTLYAMSDRWEKFGTPEFVFVKREKRDVSVGYAKVKRHGQIHL